MRLILHILGGQEYGLRSNADNFTMEEIAEGVEFANRYGAKIYVTTNIIAHDENIEGLESYLRNLEKTRATGIIVADPLIIETCKEVAPKLGNIYLLNNHFLITKL